MCVPCNGTLFISPFLKMSSQLTFNIRNAPRIKKLTKCWLYSKLLHWFDPFPKWNPIYGLRRLIHKSNFTSPHSHLNNSNTNKCWQVWFLRSLLDRNKLMACMYAHRHAQAVAWGCVISPSGSWRTAGMLIKFDCSLCRIYNSLHFSAFNKLRIQRGSPEPLPRICMCSTQS